MSRNIALAEDLYNKAADVAAKDQLSVEEFVSVLLANRLAGREFIDSRALIGRISTAHWITSLTRNPKTRIVCDAHERAIINP